MNARGRAAAGSSALLLGTIMWLLVWSRFGPAVDDVPPGHRVWQIADALSLSYRLAAIALGVGGLLLATRGWRRGAFIALGMGLGWLGLDAILAVALTPAAGTAPDSQLGFVVVTNTRVAGVVAAVVAVAGLVLVGSAPRHGRGPAQAPHLLAAAAALLALDPGRGVDVPNTIDRVGWPVSRVQAPAMIVLAVLLALAVPARVTLRRLVGAGAAAVMMVALHVPAIAEPVDRWLFDLEGPPGPGILSVLYVVLPPALLLAALVAVSGVLPRGRKGLATFMALVVTNSAGLMFLVYGGVRPWADEYSSFLPKHGYAWGLAVGSLVAAAVAAALLPVIAYLVGRTVDPAESVSPGAGSRGADSRLVLGGVLTLLGLATWLTAALVVQRNIDEVFWGWHGPGGFTPNGVDGTIQIGGLGWTLRFAPIVVAAGGLWLLAGGRWRARLAVLGAVSWAAVDAGLLLASDAAARAALDSGATGAAVAAAAAMWSAGAGVWLIAGLVLVGAGVLAVGTRAAATPGVVGSFVYSGAALGVGLTLPFALSAATTAAVSSWVPVTAAALSVLLVVTGVATADITGNRRGAGPAIAAVATALIAAVLAVGLSRWQLRPVSSGQADLRALLTCAVLGAGVLVLAWLSGHSLAGWSSRAAGVLVVIGSPAVFATATWGVLYLYLQALVVLRPFTEGTGPFGLFDGALPLTPIGVFAGGALALLCLLPQALSTPDIFGGPAATLPPPPPPTDSAGPRAPVAVPGVPEILEHPLPAVPRRSTIRW